MDKKDALSKRSGYVWMGPNFLAIHLALGETGSSDTMVHFDIEDLIEWCYSFHHSL